MDHPDRKWISHKIGGHGGAYGYEDESGMARIGYIGSTNRILILWYNLILWFRWVMRNLRQKLNLR